MKRTRITQNELESIIENYIRLNNSTYESYGIDIKDKIFTEKILFLSSEVVHFTNCIFAKGLTLYSVSHDKDVFYKGCYFLEDVSLIDC